MNKYNTKTIVKPANLNKKKTQSSFTVSNKYDYISYFQIFNHCKGIKQVNVTQSSGARSLGPIQFRSDRIKSITINSIIQF